MVALISTAVADLAGKGALICPNYMCFFISLSKENVTSQICARGLLSHRFAGARDLNPQQRLQPQLPVPIHGDFIPFSNVHSLRPMSNTVFKLPKSSSQVGDMPANK